MQAQIHHAGPKTFNRTQVIPCTSEEMESAFVNNTSQIDLGMRQSNRDGRVTKGERGVGLPEGHSIFTMEEEKALTADAL